MVKHGVGNSGDRGSNPITAIRFSCAAIHFPAVYNLQYHQRPVPLIPSILYRGQDACCSSSRALSYQGLDPPAWPIDPAWRMHLQFQLFSAPTSGPQLVHQKGCGMCCPVCGEVHIKDPLLLIGKSNLCRDSGLPLKICQNDHILDVQ